MQTVLQTKHSACRKVTHQNNVLPSLIDLAFCREAEYRTSNPRRTEMVRWHVHEEIGEKKPPCGTHNHHTALFEVTVEEQVVYCLARISPHAIVALVLIHTRFRCMSKQHEKGNHFCANLGFPWLLSS